MKRFVTVIISLISMSVLLAGCSKDSTGPEEQFGSVSGTVHFIGEWPATGDVQISIYSSYPPMGPPDYYSEPLAGGAASVDYSIDGIAKGDYAAILVGWRDPANPMAAKIIGLYLSDPDETGVDASGNPVSNPVGLSISSSNLHHKDCDIAANLDVAP